MEPLRAPFPWFGGKSRAARLIWARLGNVPNYVEPFAGSLAVLLSRPHKPKLQTVNDRDTYLANFWRALADNPEEVARFADWPVNEADLHARHLWLTEQTDFRSHILNVPDYYDSKIAGWWVWGVSQWIGSRWCAIPERSALSAPDGSPSGTRSDGQMVRLELSPSSREVPAKRPHLASPGRGVHRKRPELKSRKGVHQQLPSLYGNKGIHARCKPLEVWMAALAERLRSVRVCCGDWQRVVSPCVTWRIGSSMLTGVLLDPPYSGETGRDPALYANDSMSIAHEVREWAIANGDNPLLRIALCGYEGEHQMPDTWECVAWKAVGGYASQGDGPARANAARERVWFSPHCLRAAQGTLFGMQSEETLLA